METTIEKAKQKRRRMRGEGTIIERDGRFVGVLSLGTDGNGKRIRKWVYGDTKTDVLNEMTRLRGGKLDGTVTGGSKATLGEWLDSWIETVIKGNRRESTYAAFKMSIDKHVKPSFVGGMKLSKLTGAHLDALYAEMREAGKSPSVRRMAHTVLRLALAAAKKKRFIGHNVATDAEAPSVPKKEMGCLTPEQAVAFLQAAERNRLYSLFVLAVTTGMRQGELFALQRSDVDVDAGMIRVRRTIVEINGKRFVENEPKTTAGRRDVTLPPMAVEALRDHLARMLAEGNAGSRYVFCNRKGGPLRRGNLRAIGRFRSSSCRREERRQFRSAGCADRRTQDPLGNRACRSWRISAHNLSIARCATCN